MEISQYDYLMNFEHGSNSNHNDLNITFYKKNTYVGIVVLSEIEQRKLAEMIINKLDIKKITRKTSIELE